MSIVFEAFTTTPVAAIGRIPRTRSWASSAAAPTGGFGFVALPIGAANAEVFNVPTIGNSVVPFVRGAASGVSGNLAVGFIKTPLALATAQHVAADGAGSIPTLLGRAWQVAGNNAVGRLNTPTGAATQVVGFQPGVSIQYAGIPLVSGTGSGYGQYPGNQTAATPLTGGVAYSTGTTFGRGLVGLPYGVAYQIPPVNEFLLMVQSAGVMAIQVATSPAYVVSDSMTMGSTIVPAWVQVLQDVVSLGSSRSALFNVIQVLSDDVILGDALTLILRELLVDTLTVSSTPSSWMGLALALLDTVLLGSVPTASYDAHVVLLLGFALGSVLFDAQRGYLSDDVALADALIQKVNALALLADSWQLESTQSASAILYALLSDSAVFSDARTDYLAITQVLLDGAQFGLTLYTGQDQYVAWVMTTPTRAMRRYVNYPFNSFGEINGRLCGANANGLYWLDGDTDDGAEIPAMIRSGLMDFGSRQLKRMDRAYLGYTSDGTLGLKVITTSETGDEVAYSYKMIQKPAHAPRESRVQIGRGMRSVYWQFELINEAGSDFELHDLTLLPLILSRRVS